MKDITTIESKGKTVDDAIFLGLEELGLGIDQVDIDIIQQGNKGIFGLGKSAVVRLTKKCEQDDGVTAFLSGLFEKMGVVADITVNETDERLEVDLRGDCTSVIIGRRGETLDAIQYLTSLIVNKGKDSFKRVVIDMENYRAKREESLISLAHKKAQRVVKTGRREVLEPMNPYERRILHAALQDDENVETISEGEEPNRCVVIKRKRNL